MGGITSKTEQDLKLYLQRDYDITNYPCITHRDTSKQAIVHQITTDSTQEAHRIRADVNLYKHLNCQSISNVLEYIPLESSKLCSDQEFHYIVEDNLQKYNLKEQFLSRKYYKEKFTVREIMNVLKTVVCGLNIYHCQFQRKFNGLIRLEAITVDQKRSYHLRLTDPLLMSQNNDKLSSSGVSEDQSSSSKNQSAFRKIILNEDQDTIRQAPEKMHIRKTKFNERRIELNQLLADIYVAGILGLELYRMQPFEAHQKHQVLPLEIQSIKDKQLSQVISVMTAQHPEDRGRVFDVLKVSPQDSYHLERIFRAGGVKKQQYADFRKSVMHQDSKEELKQEKSFSFGAVPSYMAGTLSPSPLQSFSLNSSVQPSRAIPALGIEKPRNQTLSNISTDRTVYPSQTVVRPGFGSKPVVKFGNTGNIVHSTSTSSVSGFNNYIAHYQPTYSSLNTISTAFKEQNNINRLEKRTQSFLFQEEKKYGTRQVEQSPFKKQQNISPILSKQFPLQENNYKLIFDKFSHLNMDSNNGNFNKNTYSKTVESEINSLLKPTLVKDNNANNRLQSQFAGISPIKRETLQIDSPINALELNNNTTFTAREMELKNQNNSQTNEIPVYRPNKEVEEILKRLGIGSLLYGNNQDNPPQESKTDQEPSSMKNQKDINQIASDILVHKGVYNISLNPNKNVENTQMQKADKGEEDNSQHEDIPDRETTPIRPAQKNKYNSTIVQVGDQDSQYSSSGVRNTQKNVDLSNHEYVVEQYQTGSRYEGYKLNGQRDGHGKFFYQDGGYYEGQWKNNKMDGWGKLFYEGGKLAYEGNWSQDEFHGFGKVYNDNPIKLDCGFDFTNFDLLEDYWEFYEGMLVQDTKEGRGKIKLTNGEVFEGDFHNDRIQGFGRFFMKEGNVIEGIWRDSKLIKIINS